MGNPEYGCVGEELYLATRSAAAAAAPWIGRNDKAAADQAAVDAFQAELESSRALSCTVVIGEGDKDEAPMLAHGMVLGNNMSRHYDLAVDPIDGTTFVAGNKPGAIAVAALTSPGGFLPWADIHYMKKLAVGPGAARLLDNGDVHLDAEPRENMRRVATELDKPLDELRVAVLDRPRNQAIMDAGAALGVKLQKLRGGDIIPALLTSTDQGPEVDMLYGSGGAPEAVLAAAAVAALGGNMQAMWDPQTCEERDRTTALGQANTILGLDRLVGHGELHFAMTAITRYRGWLEGARQISDGSWMAGTTQYIYRPARQEVPRPALQAYATAGTQASQ